MEINIYLAITYTNSAAWPVFRLKLKESNVASMWEKLFSYGRHDFRGMVLNGAI
jgi:hypothetical protein